MENIQFKEVLGSHNIGWEQEAEALAESSTPFVLVGFSYSHHIDFYNQFILKFQLKSRLDLANERAYFWSEK